MPERKGQRELKPRRAWPSGTLDAQGPVPKPRAPLPRSLRQRRRPSKTMVTMAKLARPGSSVLRCCITEAVDHSRHHGSSLVLQKPHLEAVSAQCDQGNLRGHADDQE